MAVWSVTNVIEVINNRRIDSEFFHPIYIQAEDKVLAVNDNKKLGQLGEFLVGPFGSAFHVSNYDPTSPYRYIRGKDVKPFTLLDEDSVFMPEVDYKRLEKYAVQKDDLLISVVGTLGNVAIVPEGIKGIFSCKSTVFRKAKVDPYYLLAYFNSMYGRDCLLRRQRGAIQAGLNKDDLKTVPIPVFPDKENEIANMIRLSLQLSEDSKTFYRQAQALLEKELGLTELVLDKPRSYEATFSDLVNSSRVDAEYYNPQAKMIYNASCFQKYKTIKDMFYILRGQTPSVYFNEGTPVLKTKNIRIPIINDLKIEDYSNLSKKHITIKHKDLILASMGVGSLGRISYVFDDSSNAIIDGTLRILRVKDGFDEQIIPTLLFLTSKYGQILIYKGIIGSTGIISLPDNHLKNIRIPIIDSVIAKEITSLVISSYNAKKESEQLSEQATRRVEELIERGIGE
ncbi:type I restriction enzyme S subunit [Mobilisporobacter senegalensis]|uniref:Type I restriction enzyme S subunit n=1 Tax=Mobilisporobacter senegalensis TaxID=1329262 RepID=A0A3N1XN70_9FIRM|nr:restriction endonuclease subunit S [Mobilisporobacter senegalensis]ROR28135.1 type I restriction enzyme S subunit [Mobilisporobacter senegalensis]